MHGRTAFLRLMLFLLWVISGLLLHAILGTMVVKDIQKKETRDTREVTQEEIHNRANESLIFIGGMPRSGTTLMRTMMDAHPDIRCGQETHIIPSILNQRVVMLGTAKDLKRLEDAGVHPDALNDAVAQFIIEVIVGHGPTAKYLCNKDPYTQSHARYLRKLFPNAKFIFMVRDGRAFAHSVVSRKILIALYDLTDYRSILTNWNMEINIMDEECKRLGPDICLPVYYEQLVLQPVNSTKRIFRFLGIPWNERVLHHEKYINETKLSTCERSTDQVQKPLYLDALKSWFGKIPKDVERDMGRIAPMLSKLGYDPYDPTPSYGEPDDFVMRMIPEEERRGLLKGH